MNSNSRLSLYIHVPFCIKKMPLLRFYSERCENPVIDKFIDALIREWDLGKKNLRAEDVPITTLFFGGGTPSLLTRYTME